MKNKVISLLLWILVGWLGVYWYWHFTEKEVPNQAQRTWNQWEVSEEQISTIAEKTGISEEEIKSRLESWEAMGDIMWGTGREVGTWEWRATGWWEWRARP